MADWKELLFWDGSYGAYILDAPSTSLGDFRDAGGFRVLSLAISGTSPNFRYSAVVRKEPGAPAWDFHVAADETGRKSFAADMKAQQFYPSIVVAVGAGADTRYACVYTEGQVVNAASPSKQRTNLTLGQLSTWTNFFQNGRTWFLDWISAHGTGEDLRFNCVFKRFPKPNSVYWNFDTGARDLAGIDIDAKLMESTELSARSQAWLAGWSRPHCIAMSDDKRYGLVWHDDVWVAPFESPGYLQADATKDQLANVIESFQQDGYFPLRIAAAGVGAATRYAAIFGRIDRAVEREWVVRHAPSAKSLQFDIPPGAGGLERSKPGPGAKRGASRPRTPRRDPRLVRPERVFDPRIVELAIPPLSPVPKKDALWDLDGGGGPGSGDAQPTKADQPIAPAKTTPAALDAWMKAFMQHWGIRGAALAVARHGKLVFAGGYKWAEPDYPDVDPDSRCRIYSISKTITGIAVMQLYDEGKLDMTSSLQDPGMLELKQLDGKSPGKSNWWKSVTVSRLLCHRTGLAPNWPVDPQIHTWRDQNYPNVADSYPLGKQILLGFFAAQANPFFMALNLAFPVFQYNNANFFLLGALIERIRRQEAANDPLVTYPSAVAQSVFARVGIPEERVGIAGALLTNQAENEMRYHHWQPSVLLNDAVDPATGPVPWAPLCYGGSGINGDAHGGWSISAVDLVRVLASLQMVNVQELGSMRLMETNTFYNVMWKPDPIAASNEFRGMYAALGYAGDSGFNVNATVNTGGAPGAQSIFIHRADGVSFVLLVNTSRTAGFDQAGLFTGAGLGANEALPLNAIINQITAAGTWGVDDLFPAFGLPSFPGKYTPLSSGNQVQAP